MSYFHNLYTSGKGESIWDRFVHNTSHFHGDDTGDVATDSYHRYEQDIEAMKRLGVTLNFETHIAGISEQIKAHDPTGNRTWEKSACFHIIIDKCGRLLDKSYFMPIFKLKSVCFYPAKSARTFDVTIHYSFLRFRHFAVWLCQYVCNLFKICMRFE